MLKNLILKILFGIDVLIIVIGGVCSSLIVKYDVATGIASDGFGRTITEAPLYFRIPGVFDKWAGIGWLLFDTICGWILIWFAYILYKAFSNKKG